MLTRDASAFSRLRRCWASDSPLRAAVSIGHNPTFEGVQAKTVEAYLLDVDLDLYHRPIELELVDFVRSMHRFEGLDQLIEQMHRDVELTREAVGPLVPPSH